MPFNNNTCTLLLCRSLCGRTRVFVKVVTFSRSTPWHSLTQSPPLMSPVTSWPTTGEVIIRGQHSDYKFYMFVYYFVIAGNRHGGGFAEAVCFNLLQGFQYYERIFELLWMLHSHCRHLLAAGLDNGTITLYTWKHTADKSSGWVLLAELDQRY